MLVDQERLDALAKYADHLNTLTAYLERKDVPSSIPASVTAEQIHKDAASLEFLATTYAVGFFEGSPSHATGIIDTLQSSVTKLILETLVIRDGSSKTLEKQIDNLVKNLLHALQDLNNKSRESVSNGAKPSPHLTGVVWKCCQDFMETAFSNVRAAHGILKQGLPLIKDATQELEEDLKSKRDIDEDVWDDFGASEEMDPKIKEMASDIVTLYKCSFSMIKKTLDLLDAANDGQLSASVCDGFVADANAIFEQVDQVGSSLYEDDLNEIASQCRKLVELNQKLGDEIRFHASNMGSTWESVITFLELVNAKLSSTLQAIQDKV
eukprot:TRINITY_DN15013_c0_g1_i1.p1 TRINITY_DN15013_c0_g1~~TRINITY_DN15013_c0_g1_i1.p1  ORF type:complete len:324 (-),score=81.20 TRINITY_DN15013_c0_g1_i1:191-1162(-)